MSFCHGHVMWTRVRLRETLSFSFLLPTLQTLKLHHNWITVNLFSTYTHLPAALITFFLVIPILVMLGTRTKQVFSYGRRGHRIVSVSERHDKLHDENLTVSSGGDLPVTPLTKLNNSPDRPLTPARRARRKIRVSSLPSSPKAKAKHVRSPTKQTQRSPSSKPPSSRQPLSVNSPNVPKSAAAGKRREY